MDENNTNTARNTALVNHESISRQTPLCTLLHETSIVNKPWTSPHKPPSVGCHSGNKPATGLLG